MTDDWCRHGTERAGCVFCTHPGEDVRDGFCPNEDGASTWHVVSADGSARCCRCGHVHPYSPGFLETGRTSP